MKNVLLVLGSGATSGGFETINGKELPTDRVFFSAPVVTRLFNKETFPALHFFEDLQVSKSLEKTWSDIDLASKLTNNQLSKQRVVSMEHDYEKLEKFFQKKASKDSYFRNNWNSQLSWVSKGGCVGPLASWEAVQLILKVYGEIKEKSQSTLSKVIEHILNNSNLKGIVTFNYDCTVESLWQRVSTKSKLYYYDPDRSAGYENAIPLYKMHGSLNWCSTFMGSCEPKLRWSYQIPNNINSQVVFQKFEQGKFIGGRPDQVKEPTIIPPDLFKQNITLDIQNDSKSVLFKRIWHRVWEKLADVEVLVFIGFSFPETDHHAKFLFSTADRRKEFARIVVNYNNDKETIKRYESIFRQDKIKGIPGGIQSLSDQKAHEFISYLK